GWFGDPDEGIRASAIAAYPGEFDARLREHLLKEMTASSLEVRKAAVARLGRSGDGSVGVYLIDRLRKAHEASLPEPELIALWRSVAQLDGERYLPFVRRQLEVAGIIGGSVINPVTKPNAEVRAMLTALSEIETPEAIALFRSIRNGAYGELKDRCDELWRGV